MYFIDKWFDMVDKGTDEVGRAANAREIALQAIEKRDEVIDMAQELIAKLNIIEYNSFMGILEENGTEILKETQQSLDDATYILSTFKNNKI